MGISFIPKEEKFFDLFETQAEFNVQAAHLYKELVEKWSVDSPIFDKLREVEHEADMSTHELIDRLNRTFVTPFDREDIHAMSTELDDVVDLIQSLTLRMRLYRIEKTTPELVQLADILVQATENIKKAMPLLRNHDKHQRRLLDYCIEINRLENAGDVVLAQALGHLFGNGHNPVDIIKWKEVYETTEFAIDKCEDIANMIEGIIVKQG